MLRVSTMFAAGTRVLAFNRSDGGGTSSDGPAPPRPQATQGGTQQGGAQGGTQGGTQGGARGPDASAGRRGVIEGRAPATRSWGAARSNDRVRVRFNRDGSHADVPLAVARAWADHARTAATQEMGVHLQAAIDHNEAPRAA